MKLALIPPHSLMETMLETDYHLVLTQELTNNTDYALFVKSLCEEPTHFVILDNGLAEGYEAKDEALIQNANMFGVDEIVIPDAMARFQENIVKCEEFLNTFNTTTTSRNFNLMFVCQGQNIWEFIASALWSMQYEEITTIGIPRHANKTCYDIRARIEIANRIQMLPGFNKQIHFLGADPTVPDEALALAAWETTTQTHVRGMDTSMPYNYAYADQELHQDAPKVSRPDNYFNLRTEEFDFNLVEHNVSQLKYWCKA